MQKVVSLLLVFSIIFPSISKAQVVQGDLVEIGDTIFEVLDPDSKFLMVKSIKHFISFNEYEPFDDYYDKNRTDNIAYYINEHYDNSNQVGIYRDNFLVTNWSNGAPAKFGLLTQEQYVEYYNESSLSSYDMSIGFWLLGGAVGNQGETRYATIHNSDGYSAKPVAYVDLDLKDFLYGVEPEPEPPTDPDPEPPTDPEEPDTEQKSAIKKFVDSVLSVPMTFLDLALERLQSVNLVMAQGLNVGQYLSVFGDMPGAWQLVITSLLSSLVLIASVFMFRSIMRLYYAKKEGVKWW